MRLRSLALLAIPAILILILGISIVRAIRPPELEVTSPREGEIVGAPVAFLNGKAPGATRLSVNGVMVPLAALDGTFAAVIPLHPGVNLLRIRARKRHSGDRTAEIRVIYKPSAQP